MAKVYVSSTIADLKRERRAVMEWLVAAGHQPVHSYLPDSDTVRDSCLEDVDACDLYVLILGHRYGFQPPGDNPEGLSITQLEFRRAGQSGIPRIALLRTSIPDVSLSDLADPQRLALVSAFRAEVAREVRPAEFGDLHGLIQGLSTGVQAELAQAGNPVAHRPGRRSPGGGPGVAAGAAAGVPGRAARGCSRSWTPGWRRGGSGPRVVALCGLGGAGKTSVAVEYAHRHLAEVAVCWQFPAEDPAVLAAGFAELAAQLGAREAVDPRDPVASVHGVLARLPRPGGWWCSTTRRTGRRWSAFVPPAGPGRVLITTQNQHWPPGQALDVPVLDLEVGGGIPGEPHR